MSRIGIDSCKFRSGDDSDCASAENTVAAFTDAKIIADLQADVMEPLPFLSLLKPDRASNPRIPSPTGLVW